MLARRSIPSSSPLSVFAALAASTAIAIATAVSAPSAALARIDSSLAYTRDGCQRTYLGLLDPRQAQSWVYVNGSREHVQTMGPIVKVKVSDEDLWTQHEDNQRTGSAYFIQHDVNIDVAVTDEDLLATGDPDNLMHDEAHTGEWAYQDDVLRWYDPFDRSRLGGDYFPARVWGVPYDWVVSRAPLTWDCGHWDDGGEDIEQHAIRNWQVTHWLPVGYRFTRIPKLPGSSRLRPAPVGWVGLATQNEIYLNSNRQTTGLIQEYRKTCDEGACDDNARQDPLVRNGVETFFLAAPPKPSPTAQLTWAVQRFSVSKMNNVGKASVTPAPDQSGVNVTIDMRGRDGLERDVGYAATWYVGWNQSKPGIGFTKMRTEFTRFWCLHDFDGIGPGEFQLQLSAGNSWWYKWDAGLNSCNDSSPEVALNPRPTFETIVADDDLLPIRLRGYENDDLLPGQAIADIDQELPLNDGTYVIDDPSGNGDYRLEVRTTVLDRYDPVP